MKRELLVFGLLGSLGWASAISGISSIHTSGGVTDIAYHPDMFSRVYIGAWGTLLVAMALGIYRRLLSAWYTGFVFIFLSGIAIAFTVIPSIIAQEAKSPKWLVVIVVVAIILGFGGTLLHWGRWWSRQRSYFGGNAG